MTSRPGDQDLPIKLRMMRLLWHLGYFVRHDVSIERMFEADRRGQTYTDIDVLGIRLDPELTNRVVVVDCKSGATAKTVERLFWLSGVMQYWGAHGGFFVRTQMMTTKYSELASQLNITPVSLDQLNELEHAYRIEDAPFIGPFNKGLLDKGFAAFAALHESQAPVQNYILVKYWRDSIQQRITSLMTALGLVQHDETLEDGKKLFITAYTLSLLSLAIVQFSEPILTIAPRDKELQIRDRLLGGTEETLQRKQLMESFYDFMVGEIKVRYDKRYPISKKEFMSQFYPPYTKYFVDLVERVCLAPTQFTLVPQILDLVAYEGALGSRPVDPFKVASISRGVQVAETFKAAKDIITFAERSGAVASKIGSELRGLMQELTEAGTNERQSSGESAKLQKLSPSQMVLPEAEARNLSGEP